MSPPLSGRYFAFGSSAGTPATLKLKDGQAIITLEENSLVETHKIADISDRLGNIPRKVTMSDGATFETSDNDGIDQILGLHNSFGSRMTKLESSWKSIVILSVLTVAALFGLYKYGLPALANGAARITPAAILKLMDKGTLTTVDQVLFNKSNLADARRQQIASLFGMLAKESGENSLKLTLLFRDGGKLGANAIALPGGTVIITDQLIAAAKSEDEIAGVLAHEIGHVERRHSLRQIYRVLGIGFMVSVIGGDSGQLVEDVVSQAAALDSLTYSRKFETESDYRSAELMVGLGRDPFAFVNLLKRLTNDEGKKKSRDWFATHPGTFDRLATVKKYVESIN